MTSSYQFCFETIIHRIVNGKKLLNNPELLEMCCGSADIFGGVANPHFCHEIAKAALMSGSMSIYVRNDRRWHLLT